MTDPTSITGDEPPDQPTMIDRDVLCASCGYNLRGLSSDHNCPECANPIRNSLRGDLLEFCDPRWVARLATGANLIDIALWACIPLVVFAPPWIMEKPVYLLPPHWAITCLFAVGCWLLTIPDRREVASSPGRRARRLARAIVIAAVVEDVLLLPAWGWSQWPSTHLLFLRVATASAWVIPFSIHLRHIGLRLDHESFRTVVTRSADCSKTAVALVALIVSALIGAIVPELTEKTSLHPYVEPFILPVLFSSLISVAILGLLLLVILLTIMNTTHDAMRKAADRARHNWANLA